MMEGNKWAVIITILVLSVLLALSLMFNFLLSIGVNEIQVEHEMDVLQWCEYSNALISISNLQKDALNFYDSETWKNTEPIQEFNCFG